MNRKVINILFLSVLLTGSISAQNYKKRLALSKEFLKKVHVREVLDTMLWKKESEIFNRTEKWFKQKKLDINKGKDYEFFQWGLMHQFLFSKRHILNRIKYHYQHVDYKLLRKYITQLNKGKLQDVIFSSGLYDLLNQMLTIEIDQVKNMTAPKYLEFLVNKYKPVNLKILYNNKPVDAQKLGLDIFVETNNADYKRVSILDKEHNQILKPDGYTYEQIQKIIVRFKGQEFEFKPDKRINSYPRQFKELNSMISKYSYNQIPVWNLDILESNGHIGVKLTNVIEAKVIKNKPVQKKHTNKRLDY